MDKLWVHPGQHFDSGLAKTDMNRRIEMLAAEAGISQILAKVFAGRGIYDVEYINDFLNPRLENLHDPFLLDDMEKAVDRTISAVENKEKIVVYGDYDADGVTATTILMSFLRRLSPNVTYYIPDRLDNGYGLSKAAVDKILSVGASLIITVDCGITAFDEVNYINEHGKQVIITDHHQCPEKLPLAYAVINPCRPDSSYPFKELAGVGTVFKFIHALCIKLGRGTEYLDYLDLVAIGTIADMVSLTGENRIIARFGLKAIEETANTGLKALLDISGLRGKELNTISVGFGLAPRINAAGRTGKASRAVRLLTATGTDQAYKLAKELDAANKSRQGVEQEIIDQACSIIKTCGKDANCKVLVAAGENWHQGIIGIVASKITDRFLKPSLLISIENGVGKGSARSVKGFNIYSALSCCADLLDKFGGHEMAAGFSVQEGNIEELERRINAFADEVMPEGEIVPQICIDAFVEGYELTEENADELMMLAPFGSGNPMPVFACMGMKIEEIKTVGDNKHLKLKLSASGCTAGAIGFNMGELISSISAGDTVDAAFHLENNEWNNGKSVQLNLKDLKVYKDVVIKDTNDYNINCDNNNN